MKKLLDGGEVGRAESKNPAKQERTTWFYLSLSFGLRGRENQRHLTPTILSLRKIHQGVEYFDELNRSRFESLPATKNHQGLGDSEDESDAKVFSVPYSEINSTYPARTDAKAATAKGTLIKFLSRIILTQRLSAHGEMIKVFRVLLQLLCASAQL